MKLAVLSDIHGNREALEAVLAEAERRRAEGYVCLGDIVGYGPDPVYCLERVRNLGAITVQGNHDAAAGGAAEVDTFVPNAREAILWTQSRLDREARGYLASLPLCRTLGWLALVHASLESPGAWHYILDLEEASRCFDLMEVPACLIGHSHSPCLFRLSPGDDLSGGLWKRLAIVDGVSYIVNPGSVGQPRDGDARASFALLDTEAKTFELVRVPYDIESCQRKILAAGLPEFLAARLGEGR